MKSQYRLLRAVVLCFALLLAKPSDAETIALVGGTLIDVRDGGRSAQDISPASILIQDGKIVAVGPANVVAIPPGTPRVDARGGFLVPGLIDGFGSLKNQAFANAFLYHGVTGVLVTPDHDPSRGKTFLHAKQGPRVLRMVDAVGYDPAEFAAYAASDDVTILREWRARHRRISDAGLVADLEAKAKAGARAFWVSYFLWPDQVEIVVREARRLGVATIGELCLTNYSFAARAGVQAFVHTSRYFIELASPDLQLDYCDDPFGRTNRPAIQAALNTPPDSSSVTRYVSELAKRHVALMPTLSIEVTPHIEHKNPWSDAAAALISSEDVMHPYDRATGATYRPAAMTDARLKELQQQALQKLELEKRAAAQGVLYLAGSGTSAFGTLPGAALHNELAMLVRIGLTPRQALAAATGNFAAQLGWKDIGLIEPGRRADVLILGSDPRKDIAAADDIRVLVVDGAVIVRKTLLRPL